MSKDNSKYNILPKYRFARHRADARARGIEFLLTFEEWWHIWEASGHWLERGRKKGQYCMARHNDAGPYADGNVKIIPFGENIREAQIGNQHTVGFKHSEAFKAARRAMMMGNQLGSGPKGWETRRARSSQP